jgi:C-7 ketoreductase
LAETAEGYDTILPCPVDLTASAGPATLAAVAAAAFGRIDVLVNNAATPGFEHLAELSGEAVRAQVETNLVAPVLLTRYSLDALAAARGTVVNIGSAGALGLRAMAGSGVYAATKAGLDVLTRTWAVELANRGIRVVGVAPGLIETGVAVRAGMRQDEYDRFLAEMAPRIPSGRIGGPEEIAWWVLRLVEPEAAYANGCVLAVDGGLSVT